MNPAAIRRRILPVPFLLAGLALAGAVGARAADQPKPAEAPAEASPKAGDKATDKAKAPGVDNLAVTEHTLVAGGKTLKYRATAGTLAQKDEAGNAKAEMFFVAYTLAADPAAPAAKRPLTFVFNGGPGAASVWLHLGAAGPRKVKLGADGFPPAPPFELEDNAESWLDATDLVFIDPVGTGYSRPAKGERADQFYGVREDVQSVGAFIRLYLTRNQRWDSPKFLAGESYGTTRAAALSEHLMDQYGIALNGVVLMSTALNFQLLEPGEGNDLPYALFLPSYAATAWHHRKLAPDLQADLPKTLREAEEWAGGGYLVALGKGDALTARERAEVVAKLARYTGLPAQTLEKARWRIAPEVFRKQLLAEEGKELGRFDARVAGDTAPSLSPGAETDPSFSGYSGAYNAGINRYLRAELKFESDLPYESLSHRVGPWNFGGAGHGFLYVGDALRDAMQKNPHMKVLFASGKTDLATPYFATDYVINHLGLPAALRGNLSKAYYPSGHMMYHDPASLAQLHADVRRLIESALPKEGEAAADKR